ncbi:uncharacterized protein J3R85_004268 [Psidium guajava]|nr:uncharacterized protein J3R85_004268 [Psidium guajava]
MASVCEFLLKDRSSGYYWPVEEKLVHLRFDMVTCVACAYLSCLMMPPVSGDFGLLKGS